MEVKNFHYSRYLISVHFDRGFVPDTIDGMIEYCINFLDDLAKLARKSGKRLFATYSLCVNANKYHAHFAVSWLPLVAKRVKTAKMSNQPIARYTVTRILENNYFYVDNPKEAIKPITSRKEYVTDYVIYQPKDGQSAIFSDFYICKDFVPSFSEKKIQSYCSKHQFGSFENSPKNSTRNTLRTLILISILELALISLIVLSIF